MLANIWYAIKCGSWIFNNFLCWVWYFRIGSEEIGGGIGRRALLSLKETPHGSNATYECSPAGPCVPCLYPEKVFNLVLFDRFIFRFLWTYFGQLIVSQSYSDVLCDPGVVEYLEHSTIVWGYLDMIWVSGFCCGMFGVRNSDVFLELRTNLKRIDWSSFAYAAS